MISAAFSRAGQSSPWVLVARGTSAREFAFFLERIAGPHSDCGRDCIESFGVWLHTDPQSGEHPNFHGSKCLTALRETPMKTTGQTSGTKNGAYSIDRFYRGWCRRWKLHRERRQKGENSSPQPWQGSRARAENYSQGSKWYAASLIYPQPPESDSGKSCEDDFWKVPPRNLAPRDRAAALINRCRLPPSIKGVRCPFDCCMGEVCEMRLGSMFSTVSAGQLPPHTTCDGSLEGKRASVRKDDQAKKLEYSVENKLGRCNSSLVVLRTTSAVH